MPIHTKRIALSVMGLASALGSSLSTMDGGAALTPSDIGGIPLMAWLFAIVAGISGFLGSTPPPGQKRDHRTK